MKERAEKSNRSLAAEIEVLLLKSIALDESVDEQTKINTDVQKELAEIKQTIGKAVADTGIGFAEIRARLDALEK